MVHGLLFELLGCRPLFGGGSAWPGSAIAGERRQSQRLRSRSSSGQMRVLFVFMSLSSKNHNASLNAAPARALTGHAKKSEKFPRGT